MVAHGHVQNGVIVLDGGVQLPEGQKVTVVTPSVEQKQPDSIADERAAAALRLIGILKTDQPPPSDAEVEKIVEEAIMEKYG